MSFECGDEEVRALPVPIIFNPTLEIDVSGFCYGEISPSLAMDGGVSYGTWRYRLYAYLKYWVQREFYPVR